jgi:hypothetical protein
MTVSLTASPRTKTRHTVMPLTNLAINKAPLQDKPYKLSDEKGLYLLINKVGKYWRYDYRFEGKRKTMALGIYPEISLATARAKHRAARTLLVEALTDPSQNRKAQKAASLDRAANSFEVIANEWFLKFEPNWVPSHSSKIISRLKRDIFPWIGSRPITEIGVPELLSTLERIIDRGATETAHRAMQNCGQIFRYAIVTGRAARDITADMRGAIPPTKQRHHPTITDVKAIGPLLRAIDGYSGSFVTKCALRLAPLVFVRPGELRKAEWAEFNLDEAE